ncbi:transcription factor TFIIH complex subunit Tfb5-domain-containing protein [Aspergillus granulosus]|uniref:General transcription and DNA repair factor IIH subunit TFB5 n=1 Tax=Aspergillus granulosus TaxID=176169 RepID=A0ABR4HFA5_9EURO
MPRAVRGTPITIKSLGKLTTILPGVLIECDPSVKAIILKYDEERHDYIVEDLDDDRHLVIKESQLQNLKIRLGRELDEKVMQPEESESE